MPRISARTASHAVPPPSASGARRRINLSLRASTIDEARALGLNISRIAEDVLAEAIKTERARRWAEENQKAIDHHAARIKRHGMWNKDLVSF